MHSLLFKNKKATKALALLSLLSLRGLEKILTDRILLCQLKKKSGIVIKYSLQTHLKHHVMQINM